MADPRKENAGERAATPARGEDLADEVERARTPRTPLLALTAVWLAVALTVALVVAVAFALYVVYGGD